MPTEQRVLFRPILLASLAIACSTVCVNASQSSAAPKPENTLAVAKHAALFRDDVEPAPTDPPATTEVWGSGLARSRAGPVRLPESDKAVGVKWHPLDDRRLVAGIGLDRSAGPRSPLESTVTWKYGWDHRGDGPVDFVFGLSADGVAGLLRPEFAQTMASHISVQLNRNSTWFNAQVVVSPQMSFDALAMTWDAAVVPEFRAQTVLTGPASSIRSILNLRLGYRLTSEARPALSAGIELRITPII